MTQVWNELTIQKHGWLLKVRLDGSFMNNRAYSQRWNMAFYASLAYKTWVRGLIIKFLYVFTKTISSKDSRYLF